MHFERSYPIATESLPAQISKSYSQTINQMQSTILYRHKMEFMAKDAIQTFLFHPLKASSLIIYQNFIYNTARYLSLNIRFIMGKKAGKSSRPSVGEVKSKPKPKTKDNVKAVKKAAPKKAPKKTTPAKARAGKKQIARIKSTPKKPAAKSKQNNAQPKTKKQSVTKKPSGPLGYTADQYQKFKEQRNKLLNLGNAELKAMLKKNLQSMSGNKGQLVEKVADGIVLGRIPRCPNCFGGRPKYDSKKGTYHCSGYRDDEDFLNCHSNFTKQELKRDPWQA